MRLNWYWLYMDSVCGATAAIRARCSYEYTIFFPAIGYYLKFKWTPNCKLDKIIKDFNFLKSLNLGYI